VLADQDLSPRHKATILSVLADMCDRIRGQEDPEVKEARTDLRLNFLRTLAALRGRRCQVRLYGGHISDAEDTTFLACDRDMTHIVLANLVTPTGMMERAKVRTTDVDSIEFK